MNEGCVRIGIENRERGGSKGGKVKGGLSLTSEGILFFGGRREVRKGLGKGKKT